MVKPSSRPDSSSKADKKFERKLQFYAEVRDTVAYLTASKDITKKKKLQSRQKKLKAYDLSALSEFLPELKVPKQPTPAVADFKLNCKSRQQLILREGKQLSVVLKHPAFQVDPLAGIHQHLHRVHALVLRRNQRKRTKNGGKTKKSKKSKASSGPQSVDI